MKSISRIISMFRSILFRMLLGKEGRRIWHRLNTIYITNMKPDNFAAFGKYTQLGKESTMVPANMFLDNYTRLQNQLNFISYKGKLRVKKFSAIGSGCIIIPGNHIPTVGIPQYLTGLLHINDVEGEIVINEDCWIGAGTILLSHCKIGRGSVVAAGAVVSKEVPPYAVVAGVPAKIIASRFSLEQVIKHESILYPEEERMTREELEKIFRDFFKDKRSIGKSEISEEDLTKLREERNKLGIIDYSK